MELLLKIYGDKPSRIGVKYTYDYLALRAYEELIRKYRGEIFRLKLEPLRGQINLVLQSEHSHQKITYQGLAYRPELLKKLESLPDKDLSLQFVHLYSEGGVLLVAKPFKKQEFFAIRSYEVIGAGNFL